MSRAEDILNQLEMDEAAAKFIVRVRKGRLQRKLVCPPFFRKTGLSCLKLPAMEVRKLSKLRKKQFKRKIKMKLNRLMRKRAKSMNIRARLIGDKDIKIDNEGVAADGKSR